MIDQREPWVSVSAVKFVVRVKETGCNHIDSCPPRPDPLTEMGRRNMATMATAYRGEATKASSSRSL